MSERASSRKRPLVIAVLAAILCLLTSETLRADDDAAAARAFNQGAKLFAQGEYRQAALLFSRAFELSPHGDAAYNAALSWERAGEEELAAESYAQAIGRDLRDEARADADVRLTRLRLSLGLIIVAAPEGGRATVGERSREIPAEFFVRPGRHEITVSLGDRQVQEDIRIEAGAERVLEVDVNRPSSAGAQTPGPVPTNAPGDAGPEGPSKVWPAIGWTSLAASIAVGAGAVYVGTRARDARRDFNDSDRTDASERSRVLDLQSRTRATAISAVALGVVGITVLVAHRAGSKNVSLRLGPTGASVHKTF